MIFIDTNFFLRFLLKDIKNQYLQAKTIFKKGALGEESLTTSIIVVFEVFWVLNSSYQFDRVNLQRAIEAILNMTFIKLNERPMLHEALKLYGKTSLSLGDCYNLIFAIHQDTEVFKTFDVNLGKEFEKIVGKKKSAI